MRAPRRGKGSDGLVPLPLIPVHDLVYALALVQAPGDLNTACLFTTP